MIHESWSFVGHQIDEYNIPDKVHSCCAWDSTPSAYIHNDTDAELQLSHLHLHKIIVNLSGRPQTCSGIKILETNHCCRGRMPRGCGGLYSEGGHDTLGATISLKSKIFQTDTGELYETELRTCLRD